MEQQQCEVWEYIVKFTVVDAAVREIISIAIVTLIGASRKSFGQWSITNGWIKLLIPFHIHCSEITINFSLLN